MKHALLLTTLLLAVFTLGACKKDKKANPGAGYPKSVDITYRVTSPALTRLYNVTHVNADGGTSAEDNVALPYTKTVKRTVKYGDFANLSIQSLNGGTVKLEILVNGAVVMTETHSGTTTVAGNMTYPFM